MNYDVITLELAPNPVCCGIYVPDIIADGSQRNKSPCTLLHLFYAEFFQHRDSYVPSLMLKVWSFTVGWHLLKRKHIKTFSNSNIMCNGYPCSPHCNWKKETNSQPTLIILKLLLPDFYKKNMLKNVLEYGKYTILLKRPTL